MIFHSKIVGIKVAMPDPDQRDKILRDCKKGEMLLLERECRSSYDKNAVAVLRVSREKLGYVATEVARQIVPEIDQNRIQFEAVIENISGGSPGFLASLFGAKEAPLCFDIAITKKH